MPGLCSAGRRGCLHRQAAPRAERVLLLQAQPRITPSALTTGGASGRRPSSLPSRIQPNSLGQAPLCDASLPTTQGRWAPSDQPEDAGLAAQNAAEALVPPVGARRPTEGSALTVEPGHPDDLREHREEDGRAGRKVVQQGEDVDAALGGDGVGTGGAR